jgi:hypothetical protein
MPKRAIKNPENDTHPTEDDKLLALIRKRASAGMTGDSHNRAHVREAKKFLNLEQWGDDDKAIRVNRPCLVIDHINPIIDEVTGAQRMNMPGLKVRAADPQAKPEWAQIKEGKIRKITAELSSRMALKKASEHQLQGGRGYIRVITEYAGDDTREQKVSIIPVYNELSVIFDPSAQAWDRMDGNWFIVYERISKDSYREQYKTEPTDLSIVDGEFNWRGDEDVIIAEYFVKEFTKKTIYFLQNGQATEKSDLPMTPGEDGAEVSPYDLDPETGKPHQREVNSYKIYRYKVDGASILEQKQLWASKYWCMVPVCGKQINVDGKTYERGITKNSMDSQRMYNYFASAAAEHYGLSPKAKVFVTPQMIAGHERQWNSLNTRMDPYYLVNGPDDEDPTKPVQWPMQITPPQASSAIVAGLAQAAEEIRTTTGSLGTPPQAAPAADTSGVALRTRQQVSDVGDYTYTDNLNLAFCRVGEIILDLFPTIYDTQRKIRTLGEDGLSTKEVEINVPGNEVGGQPLSEGRLMNDMKAGRYEVAVDTGPSFTTARQEAVVFYTALVQANPQVWGLIGDILMKNQDIPEAQTVAYRIKAELIRTGKSYLLPPEEIQEVMQRLPLLGIPQKPNPLMMVKMEESLAKAEKAHAGAMKDMANAGKLQVDTRIALAEALQELAQLAMGQGQEPSQIPGQGGPQGGMPGQGMPPGTVRQ